MQLFSVFENNINLEMAITTLEKNGIPKENIFAVPLDNRNEERKIFDSLHRSDGTSLVDIGMALGTALAVVGASIGFKLFLGPIIWGIIGAVTGFIIGFIIRLFTEKVFKKRKRIKRGKMAEVILIIECPESQAERVEQILWDHLAIGLAKLY